MHMIKASDVSPSLSRSFLSSASIFSNFLVVLVANQRDPNLGKKRKFINIRIREEQIVVLIQIHFQPSEKSLMPRDEADLTF